MPYCRWATPFRLARCAVQVRLRIFERFNSVAWRSRPRSSRSHAKMRKRAACRLRLPAASRYVAGEGASGSGPMKDPSGNGSVLEPSRATPMAG